jgi:hypothetical protein
MDVFQAITEKGRPYNYFANSIEQVFLNAEEPIAEYRDETGWHKATPEQNATIGLIGQKREAQTFWVWTQKGEERWNQVKAAEEYEERRAGTPVYEHYKNLVPALWVVKGYVMDSSEFEKEAN